MAYVLLAAALAVFAATSQAPRPSNVECEVAQVVVAREVRPPSRFDPTPLGPSAGAYLGRGWGSGPAPSDEMMRIFGQVGDQRSAADCRDVMRDLRRRRVELSRAGGTPTSDGPPSSIRIGLPVVSPRNDEAIASVVVVGGTLSGMASLLYLRRDGSGAWRIVNVNLLAAS